VDIIFIIQINMGAQARKNEEGSSLLPSDTADKVN